MRWQDIGSEPCSVARALSVIGDRWTLLILWETFRGTHRFSGFRDRLGIARHVLTTRLRALVDHGILSRVAYQEKPRRYEYRLTEKGHDLYPVIISLLAWGDRWMAGGEGAPIELTHRHCGHPMSPVSVCPECGKPARARDMEVRPGPALRQSGDVP